MHHVDRRYNFSCVDTISNVKPMKQGVKSDDQADASRPGAPALAKGLDLLEALAAEPNGISQKQLAARVGRSVGEIFRMLGVLEQRGYVIRNPKTGEYS